MAYQKQTWENLPNQTTPITAERLNHMEDGIYDANEQTGITVHDEYSSSTTEPYSANYVNNNFNKKSTILWTNESPTANFSGQTVNVDLSEYDAYEIIYNTHTTVDVFTLTTGIIPKICITKLINVFGTSSNGPYTYYREITSVTDSGITFDTGHLAYGSTLNSSPAQLIPIYIIGHKTDLFN